jgi:hypothetical protein
MFEEMLDCVFTVLNYSCLECQGIKGIDICTVGKAVFYTVDISTFCSVN